MQLNRMVANIAAAVLAKAEMLMPRAGRPQTRRRVRPAGKPQGYAGAVAVRQAQARGFRYIQRQLKRQRARLRIGKPPRHIREKIELLHIGS